MPRAPEPSRGVRTDIQALRALAVAAVLLFHLWPNVVPGGYVGVDVFFVISGFLITGQLVRELDATGRVRLASFYARRIRRLLPAAFVVLAFTLILLVVVVPRVVWRENLTQIRAASAYLVNWQLVHDQADYLAADTSPTLVQHYWSLAVEEQFYVVWPLLLVVAFAWGKRLRVPHRTTLAIVLGVTMALSFAYAVETTASSPAFSFFATQSRIWEFALGGLMALAPAVVWRAGLGGLVRWSGVALVLASCVLFGEETLFPGWPALLPTVGCALAIAGRSTAPRGSLARPVVWLGDHSYAVYLWHWPPIIVLPWVLHGRLDNGTKVGIVAGTLLLAFLTKRYVEDPVRSGAAWQFRRWASIGLATAGATAMVVVTTLVWADYDRVNDQVADRVLEQVHEDRPCFGAAAIMDPQCPGRFARPAERLVDFAPADVPPVKSRCQLAATAAPEPTYCWFGDTTSPRSTIALVGNSHAARLVPLLLEWAKGRHVRILLAWRTDCLALSAAAVPGQDPSDPCLAWSARVQARLLTTPNLSLVVFTGYERARQFLTGQGSPSAAALDAARRHVLGSLHLFASAGIPTLVVKHPPGTRPWAAPECVARSRASADPCALSRARVTGMDFLSGLASRHPELTSFLSLDRYFCTALTCHVTIGGVVAYSDALHISATYARTLAPYVGPAIDAAMRVRPAPRPRS